MDVTVLEARHQARAAVLDQVHLDSCMAAAIPRKESGQQGLHRLRRGADTEHAGLAALEGARPLPQRVGTGQELAGSAQEILALRSEARAPSDPVEEPDAELVFERSDLAGQRGLTQVEP